ncbi:hypothetical protein MKW98_004118 [Papaver atlanticum]|uniref:SKP1 component POZ domain-containing protein n=1 Tax=Papaver atlanticum TaxID=357466 RepID=A0AAD4XP97_9MAGN|nr:hypothetical protein MKW98_004118 [Papaver atlanticum]
MSPPNTIITLKSSDGQTFDIEETTVLQSRTLTTMTNILIPVNNVRGNILTKVIEYCTKHADNEYYYCSDEEEMKNWDAYFLNIPDLVDLLLWKMADMIHGKTLDEIHILFPGMFAKRVEKEEDED